MNLCLLLAMSGFSSQPMTDSTNPPPDQGRYCNERFNFCSEFPDLTFPFQADFHDGDGILLRSEDGFAEATIAGYRQFEGRTSKEIYHHAVNKLAAEGERIMHLNSLFGEDFYEAFFMVGRKQYYHQAFLFDGYVVRLSISVPINQPMLLQNLRQIVTLEFPSEKTPHHDTLGIQEP